MITKEELLGLLASTETYRIERTISTTNMDKFCEAICAFSNDLPNSRKNGYLILGAYDDGTISGLKVDDALMKKIAAIRSDGNILPIPVMSVERFDFPEGDLLVAEVTPSFQPPVRYRGRTFVRIGPRRDIATEDEERILIERRTSAAATFDVLPCMRASLSDIHVDKIMEGYLPKAIDADILADDDRPIKEQLASIGFFDLESDRPTNAAMILFGKNPFPFIPGHYLQYVQFDGDDNGSEILNERAFRGCLFDVLPQINTFVDYTIVKSRPVPISTLQEKQLINYPADAVRELILNAYMHRDYQSNTPIRLYQYRDRLEIMNAGGLYGKARPENFPNANDYRNPVIAGALKILGYVNMFNRGIPRVKNLMRANGNPDPVFVVDQITHFNVIVPQSHDASGTKSGPSRDQVGIKSVSSLQDLADKIKVSVNEIDKILGYCQKEHSMNEIMAYLGYASRTKFSRKYVKPLIDAGLLVLTIPDKPNSRLQKYRTRNTDV